MLLGEVVSLVLRLVHMNKKAKPPKGGDGKTRVLASGLLTLMLHGTSMELLDIEHDHTSTSACSLC